MQYHETWRWQFQYHSLKKLCNRSFFSWKYVSLIHFFLFNCPVISPVLAPSPCPLCVCVSGPSYVISRPHHRSCWFHSSWRGAVRPLDLMGHWPVTVTSSLVRPTLSCHTLFCHNSVTYRTWPHLGPWHFEDGCLLHPPFAKAFTVFCLLWALVQTDLFPVTSGLPARLLTRPWLSAMATRCPLRYVTSPLHIHTVRLQLARAWETVPGFVKQDARDGLKAVVDSSFFLKTPIGPPRVLTLFLSRTFQWESKA